MTSVADVTEFELSKENIQPIQQGRKAEVLKSALAVQPEDKLIHQRRLFEQELRTYSGDDPLSVWCSYIKWVEQNYPKGGREGNICKLIQQCLLILKDEKQYHNDERFVDVWLKFANMSMKPLEVYSNMFSRGIGCQSAKFYIAWAWEAEQLGNLKRADEILIEGVRRNAQPLDTLKSTHSKLEMRLAQVFGKDTEKLKSEQLDEPEQRSAFTMLKAQDKNKAPVSRIGDSIIATNRQNMTIRQQQQQTKNSQVKNAQTKIPFKIYSGDSDVNNLPSQNKKGPSFAIHSEGMKENEKKPSKWTKVKVQQTMPHVREATKTQEFTVHCDNTPQPNPVKKVPQTSQVLSSRKQSFNPPIAIFEPPNPMVTPMYDKIKVYGGVEEFAFEEIRALKWFEKQRKAEKEQKRLLEEQEKEELKIQMKKMEEKIMYLENLTLQRSKEKDTKPVSSDAKSPEQCSNPKEEKFEAVNTSKSSAPLLSLSLTLSSESESSVNAANEKKDDLPFLQQSNDTGTNEMSSGKSMKFGNTYMANEVDCMMRELYNGTLGINTSLENDLSFGTNLDKNNYKLEFDGLDKNNMDSVIPLMNNAKKSNFGFEFTPLSDALSNDSKPQEENKQLCFAIYHDPTEVIPTLPAKPASTPFPIFHDENQVVNDENTPPAFPPAKPTSTPFPIFHDENQVVNDENTPPAFPHAKPISTQFPIFHDENQVVNDENSSASLPQSIPHQGFDNSKNTKENAIPKFNPTNEMDDNIPPYNKGQDEGHEDVENVPPLDYVQNTEKRELAGILQPSKNIYYVPLEEQLQEEEEIGGGCLEGIRPLDENVTMLTAEQFAAAACFVSTPCVKSQSISIRESAKKSDPHPEIVAPLPPASNYHEDALLAEVLNDAFNLADAPKIKDILKQIILDIGKKDSAVSNESYNNVIEMLNSCNELSNSEKLKSTLQRCASLIKAAVSKLKDFNQTNARHCHTLQLSTIMETSRESKSSSSSSSCMTSMLKHKSLQNFTQLNFVSKLIKTPIPEVNHNEELSQALELGPQEKNKSELIIHADIKNEAKAIINECDIDPFSPDLTSKLLKSLKVPLSQRDDFYDCKDSLLQVKAGVLFKLGTVDCMVENLYAEGAYAKVYSAQCIENIFIDSNNTFVPSPRVAIKVCKDANEWEFYICSELAERLNKEKIVPDITNSILRLKCAGAYRNGLAIVSDLFEQGTLLDVVNVYKMQKTRVPECLVMFFTLEMLHIVSGMHNCGIVHADIKPDNFVLNDMPATDEVEAMIEQPRCLRLIDFGRAIDLTVFKPGVTFSIAVKTDAFQCVQMRESRPWVYETDWYGVLACIHILLFSEYMDVRKNAQGQWEPVQKFKRYFQNDIWQPLFQSLLNIPSPYEIPDLTPFIELLTQKLRKQLKDFKMQVLQMGLNLVNRPRPTY